MPKRRRATRAKAKEEAPKERKVKKERARVSRFYSIEGGKIKRLLPTCDRCGPGYFMADHGDRYACGHCGFTKYKRKA